jgi:hypothetical protein
MHQTDARALTTVVTVVHGREDHISHPDEEDLIWYGDLRWDHANGKTPSCKEFDWLIDHLVDRPGRKQRLDCHGATTNLKRVKRQSRHFRQSRVTCMDPELAIAHSKVREEENTGSRVVFDTEKL